MNINPLIVTSAEAAKMLRISPSVMLGLLSSGEIPAFREGRCWKIPITLLTAYVENKALAEARGRKERGEGYEMESE